MKLIKTLLPVVALTLSGLATASIKNVDGARSVVVKYGDLDLKARADVARLHKRIANAAKSVCSHLETRGLGLREIYNECVADAIANGVNAVDSPNLTQFHLTRGKPAVLASNVK